MGVHESVISMLRSLVVVVTEAARESGAASLSASGVVTKSGGHAFAGPVAQACFLFLAAFVHKNNENKALVWKGVSDVIEKCIGFGVFAEVALAEVSLVFARVCIASNSRR